MSLNHEAGGGLPENILETAEAIAYRDHQVSELSDRIKASLAGTEYKPKPMPEQRQQIIGQTALNILRVSDPEANVPVQEWFDATLTESNYDEFADIISDGEDEEEGGIQVTGPEVKNMLSEVLSNMPIPEKKPQPNGFTRSYNAACAVAQEKGVTVAEVYTNDDLYYESCRLAETPEEFAARAKQGLEVMSGEAITSGMANAVENLLPSMPKEFTENLDKDFLNDMLAMVQNDPGFSKMMEMYTEPPREAMRQLYTYLFLKTYGYNSLVQLPAEARDGFTPRKPWVKEVFADFMSA